MKLALVVFAYSMLAVGLLSMVTPMAGGTLLIASGCALLICTSERAARKITELRASRNWLNRSMTWIEGKMEARLSGPMQMTRPIFKDTPVDE